MTTMETGKTYKIVNIGIVDLGTPKGCELFCKIELNGKRLSITGVEGPLPSGNCRGSCGQIDMHEWNFKKLHKGWTLSLVRKFRDVWKRWHLNDMKAGTPKQEQAVKEWLDAGNKYEYQSVRSMLDRLNLLIDESYIHNGKPYEYGTAWLVEELPDSVISFLVSLPKASKEPAWV